MRHRLRNVVWRELPFSARRAIMNGLRVVDDFERVLYDFWQNLRYSPAWLFVAVMGSAGIVLTILLFITLSRELLARAEGRRAAPRIDHAELVLDQPSRWDTRLCLEDEGLASRPYDAEFAFRGKLPPLQARRPQPRREPDPVVMIDPMEKRAIPVLEAPQLESLVDWWRQPQQPLIRPEILTALSEMAALAERSLALGADGWDRGVNRPKPAIEIPLAYTGDPDLNTATADEDDVWADPTAFGNQADIALRVQLHAPRQAGLGQAGHSEIVIRNEGNDAIRRVMVTESTALLPFITGAHPSARLHDGLLEREFRRLRPNRERSLSLDWFARDPGTQQHEAIILAEAVVSATVQVEAGEVEKPIEPDLVPEEPPRERPRRVIPTVDEVPMPRPPAPKAPEPEPIVEKQPEPQPVRVAPPRPRAPHPAVACKVKSAPAAKVNDIIELQVEVQNTGETALSNVRIWADVPGALKHQHGSQLELAVGELEPGQVHHAVLRVVGKTAGAATANFRVVSAENIKANAVGKVAIVAPKPVKAAPKITPRVVTPTCPCECQTSGVVWAGYEF